MPHSHCAAPAGASAIASATPFPELNDVLARLVEDVRDVLGETFVGAYLHGSFALGDFDEASGVDALIAVAEDVAPETLPALQALHARIFALPSPWAQRLELSYAPLAILRHKDGQPRDPPGEPRADDWADPATSGLPPAVYPFWFLGNATQALVRSEHDNSQVVRWVTREAGVALAGPPAAELIDPVTPEALKAEVRETLAKVLRLVLDDGLALDQQWLAAFFVTFACRALHSLESGRVTSKPAASAWAAHTLGERWSGLIERALQSRLEPQAVREAPPHPAEVEATLAFLRAVRQRAVIERQLALKRAAHGVPGAGRAGPRAGGAIGGKPSRGPAPIRPGGRGRRG
ncbi:aminoglycoside adenylyltransferase domain-containing protein [Caulobacter sp. KR2-114]|uniref:aminoglycoside adenylyltransferase domain-containing protein n=1 Tax=Caulobacter sp. KR2-114 TaxID=3400912 RepID=UPI003BFAC5C8